MYFEHDKLRGRMAERGYNIRMLAKEIGIHENTLSNKLYSNTFFTQYEIVMICKVLGIADSEIPMFFFRTDSLDLPKKKGGFNEGYRDMATPLA